MFTEHVVLNVSLYIVFHVIQIPLRNSLISFLCYTHYAFRLKGHFVKKRLVLILQSTGAINKTFTGDIALICSFHCVCSKWNWTSYRLLCPGYFVRGGWPCPSVLLNGHLTRTSLLSKYVDAFPFVIHQTVLMDQHITKRTKELKMGVSSWNIPLYIDSLSQPQRCCYWHIRLIQACVQLIDQLTLQTWPPKLGPLGMTMSWLYARFSHVYEHTWARSF